MHPPRRPPRRAPRARILDAARARPLRLRLQRADHGRPRRTNSGMSKKTLYVHFPGKDAIAGAVIDEIGRSIRGRMDAILGDRRLNFTQKLAAVIDVVGSTLAQASPGMLHNLQRYAPRALPEDRRRALAQRAPRVRPPDPRRPGRGQGARRASIPISPSNSGCRPSAACSSPPSSNAPSSPPGRPSKRRSASSSAASSPPPGHHDYEKHIASRTAPAAS